ncbi:hypothetical protein AURDEDRAFT_184451 [Auricularia subglabra TFB-10046 SS5]|nr:hypothetical protein AURDEDRAFT_184451 [Auricularia subglabra TFB-10046 SS5]
MSSEGYTLDAPYFPLPTVADAALPNQVWYFEAVSTEPNSRASLQVVFMAGLPFPGPPLPFFATVAGTRHDGSRLPEGFLLASGAKLENGEGHWEGVGGWTVRERVWTMRFGGTTEKGEVKGGITLAATVPHGHFPAADENQVVPLGKLKTPLLAHNKIGWVTTVPGATAEVEITVGGEELKFKGSGFHDTNFVNGVWTDIMDDWYWTRGAAGRYTFTVYHFVPRGTGTWHTSALLYDGDAAVVDAWTGSAAWGAGQRGDVAPVGMWPKSPAEIKDGAEVALRLTFSAGEKRWAFDVTSIATVVSSAKVPYGRWAARTRGGVIGADGKQETETGVGSFDWFVL